MVGAKEGTSVGLIGERGATPAVDEGADSTRARRRLRLALLRRRHQRRRIRRPPLSPHAQRLPQGRAGSGGVASDRGLALSAQFGRAVPATDELQAMLVRLRAACLVHTLPGRRSRGLRRRRLCGQLLLQGTQTAQTRRLGRGLLAILSAGAVALGRKLERKNCQKITRLSSHRALQRAVFGTFRSVLVQKLKT